MTEHTKELINLAGQLDWRVRNGKLQDSLVTVNAIEYRLNRVKKELQLLESGSGKQ